MFSRGRVRMSPGASGLGMVVGIVFVFIGIAHLDRWGGFGVLWTLGAAAITALHGYNAFSKRGVALYEVEGDLKVRGAGEPPDFEAKLRKLEELKKDGLVSGEEFARKRAEIMGEKW